MSSDISTFTLYNVSISAVRASNAGAHAFLIFFCNPPTVSFSSMLTGKSWLPGLMRNNVSFGIWRVVGSKFSYIGMSSQTILQQQFD